MRMSEKEKEEKREFESKRKEADGLEHKINVTGWIKINNVFEEFVKENKTESINGLNKILQELE